MSLARVLPSWRYALGAAICLGGALALLHEIVSGVREIGCKRLVIDSLMGNNVTFSDVAANTGHWAQWEHADKFNRMVVEFLGR